MRKTTIEPIHVHRRVLIKATNKLAEVLQIDYKRPNGKIFGVSLHTHVNTPELWLHCDEFTTDLSGWVRF